MLGLEPPEPSSAEEDEVYILHPENEAPVTLFCHAQSQWRHAPSGRRLGLDYPACEAAGRGLNIPWNEAFPGLQVMEAVVLSEMDED